MKITCYKYQFANGTDLAEQNYFSNAVKTLAGTLDLEDYLVKDGLGKITYSRQAIDESNSLFIEAGTVQLQLSNTLSGWGSLGEYIESTETRLHDFFEMENRSQSFLFVVDIRNSDREDNLFYGVIRQDAVRFQERTTEIIEATVLSLDKEFADYYGNEELIAPADIPGITSIYINLTGLTFHLLTDAIRSNFPNANFTPGSGHFMASYLMADRAYIYSPQSYLRGTPDLKLLSGYESFYLDKLDRFTWLNSLCLSMGWKWFFRNGSLQIQKLYNDEDDVNTLDASDFISHSYYVETNKAIRNVAIEAGEYYGVTADVISTVSTPVHVLFTGSQPGVIDNKYYYLGGMNYKVYDGSNNPVSNDHTPFRQLQLTTFPGNFPKIRIGVHFYAIYHNYEQVKVIHQTQAEDKLRLKIISNIISLFQAEANTATQSYNDAQTLRLKPYIPSHANSTHLDISQARTSNNQFYGNGNAYNPAQDPGVNGMYVRGNPGYSLLKFVSADTVYEDYNHYTNSQEFYNNMKTLIGGSNNAVIEAEVSGIYDNVGELFNITNYPYSNIDGVEFIADNIEIDLINQTTKLTLKSI